MTSYQTKCSLYKETSLWGFLFTNFNITPSIKVQQYMLQQWAATIRWLIDQKKNVCFITDELLQSICKQKR